MGGARRAEQTAVGLEVEVELHGVDDVAIDDCTCRAVPALVSCSIGGEEADVVALPDHNDGDGGVDFVVRARPCRSIC